ncbi:helix-turn-helix domain-containing protein [Amycolatopsis sp. NPDC003865]
MAAQLGDCTARATPDVDDERPGCGIEQVVGPGGVSVGEVAGRFGLPAHVLPDLFRVAVIMRAKEAGFGLEGIRQMIATPDVVERRDILRRQRGELARRIAEAHASLALIECALERDPDDFAQCDEFRAMVAARIGVESRPHDQICAQYS